MFELDEEPGIDLTPLIDVVFMLLVFFIMSTSFSKPVLDIILPTAQQAAAPQRQKEIIIAVKADGSVYHNEQKLAPQDVLALLHRNPDTLLNLYVDKNAPFEAFVSVVDAAKQQRGNRFVISTQSPAPR